MLTAAHSHLPAASPAGRQQKCHLPGIAAVGHTSSKDYSKHATLSGWQNAPVQQA